MRWEFLTLVIFGTSGCVGPDPAAIKATMDRDLPANYKTLIIDSVKKDFFDPYSVRGAGIAEPKIFINTVVVCTQANAKNRMGGYTGLSTTIYTFNNGHISIHEQGDSIMCPADTFYKPFPEMEHIT